MGFPGYFLIVQDFINVARHKLGVSVGPGRGSAAGSVVAYCLRASRRSTPSNMTFFSNDSSTPTESRCLISTSTSMTTGAPMCSTM